MAVALWGLGIVMRKTTTVYSGARLCHLSSHSMPKIAEALQSLFQCVDSSRADAACPNERCVHLAFGLQLRASGRVAPTAADSR